MSDALQVESKYEPRAQGEKSSDAYEEIVASLLSIFRHASSIAKGRGSHNKVPMKERVRWARIAIDAGSHLLERDILDKYKRRKVEMNRDELLGLLSEGKIDIAELR